MSLVEMTSTEAKLAERITNESAKAVALSKESGGLVLNTAAEAMELAKMMAVGGIAVRKHLRGQPGACLGVIIQALEWRMSPYAVANKSYSVNDQLAYESQLIQAVIYARAPIKGRMRFTFEGEAENRVCIAAATLADGTGDVEYRSPVFSRINPKNSPLWKSDPDQQHCYYSGRALCRRYFPDVLMGVYAEDELPGGGRFDESGERIRVINPLEDDIDGEFTVIGEPGAGGAVAGQEVGGGGEAAPASDKLQAAVNSVDLSDAVERMKAAAVAADRPPFTDDEEVRWPAGAAERARALSEIAEVDGPETAGSGEGAPPAADLAGPIPETAAVHKARERGAQARRDGKAREVPALYKRPGREDEETAWLTGFDVDPEQADGE